MRIVVTAAGTRGDVQPCVALGRGLRAAGHEVTLASWEPYRWMATAHGLAFHPVAGPSPEQLMSALVGAGRDPARYARAFRPLLRPFVERGLRDNLAACEGADAVVYTPLGFAGFMAAEHLGIPAVGSVVEPLFVRGGRYPSAVLGSPPAFAARSGLYNRLSHRAVEQIYWRIVQPLVAEAREKTGLPTWPVLRSPVAGIHHHRRPLLLAWSPHVLPADPRREGRMPTTGYWFLDPEGWQPPRELRAFLEAGDPPVALGLGSLGGGAPAETACIASLTAEALGRTGERGVLLSGHAAVLPDGVIQEFGEVPYGWLFARASVAVHHGGAGTLAAAIRAGIPSVVVPAVPDQAFWGWRAAKLGISPPPIPPRRLTPARLSAAIRHAATDADMRRRCRLLAGRVAAEDGVGRAVAMLERYAEAT